MQSSTLHGTVTKFHSVGLESHQKRRNPYSDARAIAVGRPPAEVSLKGSAEVAVRNKGRAHRINTGN